MKGKFLFILLCFLFSIRSSAQTTSVTFTITDLDGIAWTNGNWTATFIPNPSFSGPYKYLGANFVPQTFSGVLDGSGHGSGNIPDNNCISPAGSQWQFTLQSYTSAPATNITTIVTGSPGSCTGGTKDFTTLFSAGVKAPRFSATAGSFGYSTVEVTQIPNPGGQFYNVTLGCMEIWSGSVFACNNGGGGANPAGNNGDVQTKNGANLAASGLNETNGVLTNTDTNSNRGPNPSVDITAPPFNASAVSTSSIPLTTGTITGGTNSLVVASNTGWQKNYGLSQVGGGATNCGTTPSAPLVTPSIASSMPGTGHSVPGATGSTSYSYVVIAISKGGCYTAASSIGTTSAGNATLGATNLPITSFVNLAGTVTATVGSTTGLATGMYVRIGGSTDDGEFGGYHNITVLNGTQFTYTSNVSSIYPMFSTTATGGTLYFQVANHIALPALPAGTNMYKFAVYRCTGASCALPANAANYSLVYISYPANLGFIDVAYNTWDDYGTVSTVNSFSTPWFIPTTPPAANVNDMLVTSITNISGTTFTLAANATNSTTSLPVRFDGAPAITACEAASNTTSSGGGGSCHMPPQLENGSGGVLCYVTSSYLVLNSITNIGGAFCPGETVELSGARSALNGTGEDTIHSTIPGFGTQTLLQWTCLGANPCIWRKGAPMRNLYITSSGPGEMLVFDSTAANQTLTENVHFNVPDGMGIGYLAYEAAFGGYWRNTGWTGGPSQVIGATAAPLYINRDSIQTNFDNITGSLRGLYFECTNNPPNSCANYISIKQGNEWQGPITPLVTINASNGGRVGWVYLEHMIQDSGAEPIFVSASNGGANLSSLIINGTNQPGRDPGAPLGGNQPVISGNTFGGGVSLLTDSPLVQSVGMNHDLMQCPQANIPNPSYRGCVLPSLNLANSTYSANHTLTASEGVVNITGTATITVPHALAGQTWFVYSQSGTTTLAIDSGTLYGNGATGSFVIPNSSGVFVTADGTNAHAGGNGGGGGGGCAPGGITNAFQYNGGGTCSFNGVNAPTIAGDYVLHYPTPTSSSVAPTRDLVGIPINPQTGTTYVEGSANYQCDRGFLITASNAGAQTYTVGNPASFCFSQNYFNVLDNINTGVVTETASGFSINGAGSFVTPPSWIRWLWSNGVNDFAEAVPTLRAFPNSCTTAITVVAGVFNCGAAGAVSSWSGDGALYNNSSSVGAVTATLANAGANTVWGRCVSSTGLPSYCQITDTMLTAVSHAALFNAGNTWTGLQDFSGATWKIPTLGGFTAGAASMCGYDSTAKITHCLTNGADSDVATTTTTSTIVTQVLHATAVPSIYVPSAIVTADLPAQYTKGSCMELWGGSGSSFVLTSGDDAISNNSCYNDSGVTRTITAVKCFSDNAANTTTVNPTFGASGTGTTILSGALTCGNSNAMSASGTVSNASWTTGTGIDPVMGGTLTGTHIAMIVEYTF
jgi:hypothetical protein